MVHSAEACCAACTVRCKPTPYVIVSIRLSLYIVRYFNGKTGIGIIRVPRDTATMVLSSMFFVKKIDDVSCHFEVLHVSGTIIHLQFDILKRNREFYLRECAAAEEKGKCNHHIGVKLLMEMARHQDIPIDRKPREIKRRDHGVSQQTRRLISSLYHPTTICFSFSFLLSFLFYIFLPFFNYSINICIHYVLHSAAILCEVIGIDRFNPPLIDISFAIISVAYSVDSEEEYASL